VSQHGAHAVRSHTGEHWDQSGVREDRSGMALGSVGDRLAGPGDGPIGLSTYVMYIVYIYIVYIYITPMMSIDVR
jgi:hypothetical protein